MFRTSNFSRLQPGHSDGLLDVQSHAADFSANVIAVIDTNGADHVLLSVTGDHLVHGVPRLAPLALDQL